MTFHWLNDKFETLSGRVELAMAGRGVNRIARILRVVEWLTTEPVVRDVFGRLLGEEDDDVRAFRSTYDECVNGARSLRHALETSHPSWLAHTDEGDALAAPDTVEWFDGASSGNYVATSSMLCVSPGGLGRHEANHIAELFSAISSWIPAGAPGDWTTQYLEIRDRWRVALRARRFSYRSPGAAAARLRRLLAVARRESPRTFDEGLRWLALRNTSYGALYETYLDVPARDRRPMDAKRRLREADQALASDLEMVAAEVRFRLLDARSKLSLLLHFKHRSEAFGEVLRERTKNARRKEDVLRDACASFLFDSGLPVVTEASVARLRADVIGAPVYIEAKQYSGTSGRIVAAARQVWSTLHRLRGSPHGAHVREAFCVVYRLSGSAPLYVFPSTPVSYLDYRTYFLLIDLAPTLEAGSREPRAPIVVTETDLLPMEEDELQSRPTTRHRRRRGNKS